jgi:intron-binding protein aquarius
MNLAQPAATSPDDQPSTTMAPRTRGNVEDRQVVESSRPTVSDLQGDNPFAQLAKLYWLKSSKRAAKVKVKPDVVKKEIWDVLEQEDFSYRSLLTLENLQILERQATSNVNGTISILIFVQLSLARLFRRLFQSSCSSHCPHHKCSESRASTYMEYEQILFIPYGIVTDKADLYANNPSEFSSLFRRILSMALDTTQSQTIRTHLLTFIISAFQSLDSGIVRKECAPLVSISMWHNLSSDVKREKKLNQSLQLRKAWRAAAKRYDAAEEDVKSRLRFERSWLYTLLLDFLSQMYNTKSKAGKFIPYICGETTLTASPESTRYCERFIEFLSNLQSQLPTRRYVNTLLQDLHLLPAIRLSPAFNDVDNGLLRDLYALLKHYTYFSIDDHTGVQHSRAEAYEQHCGRLATLQRVSLKHFKDKLTILALSNYGSIDKREELEGHLQGLSDAELKELCHLLELRTEFPASATVVPDRQFLTEVLVSMFEKRKTFQESARELSILPTEHTLFEASLLRNEKYDGSQPLALPKLNLQYLTVGDFLWRSFILHRCESFFEIRKDIEETIKRLRPTFGRTNETRFEGFSKMALPITKPA